MPDFLKQWDYSGHFLAQFPRNAQSTVANIFCNAVRAGASDVDDVIRWIGVDVIKRLANGGTEAMTPEVLEDLQAALDTSEAYNFAAFILWREKLSPAERERLKNAKGRAFVIQRMADEPPTPAQLNYLQSLGCRIMPQSKLEASQLIEKYKGGAR